MVLSISMPFSMVLVWEVPDFFYRVTGVTQAKSNTGHPSFFFIYILVLDPNRPNTGHLNGF